MPEGAEAAALAGAAGSVGAVTELGDQQVPAADAVLESHTHQDASRTQAEGDQLRDRRSRDRYGRDRRERGEHQPRDEGAVAANETTREQPGEQAQEERTPRYPTGFVTEEEKTAPQPLAQPTRQQTPEPARPVSAEPVAAAAPAAPVASPAHGLPKVRSFELPVDELAQVAEGSGLQWVNSDAQKIAAVQAAIAAEPQPPRVPRERPPAAVLETSPLVLVETRRDLRDLTLPFEPTSSPLQ
jgi:ribonuclease E